MKRVLVCSVMCWNKITGSDTFSTLMQGYEVDNIANLYIREGQPDSDVCRNYFEISENAVIKSVLKRKTRTGKRVKTDNAEIGNVDENALATAARYSKHQKNRSYCKLFARELLWKLGKWKTKELNEFLDEFKPDVVFFAMEGYIHFARINRYILKKTGAKGIAYFWDDNFTYKKSKKLGYKLLRFFQRRSLKKLSKLCTSFFAISPKTKREADETFGINCEVLTKPIDFENKVFVENELSYPLKMVYTGKLIIGRYDTVELIGRALDEINKDQVKIELDVYTMTEIADTSKLSKYVHLKGAIPQTEVAQVQQDADILLFVEAIEGAHSRAARLSFSTKITDYLGSGKCVFAVGNKDVAPMEYLKEEDGAITAYDYESVLNALKEIANNPELVKEYAKKAYELGKRNHDKKIIQERLFSKFQEEK